MSEARSGGRLSALGAPLYRRFWFGSLASIGGTQLVMMGQAWLVFELSGSAADLAVLGAVSSLPTILVTLAGGVAADRFDRRQLMLATTPALAALLLFLTVADATDRVTVWQVWIIAALFAAVSGFDWPARQAIFTALIERRHMMSAVALNSMLWQGTRMVMPAVGGLVIAAATTAAVFGLATLGFLVMLVVLLSLRVDARGSRGNGSWRALKEGLHFVATTPLFAVLIPLTYVTMFFGTSYLQIMPLFADRLGSDAQGFGVLVSASGVGSLAGTLLVGSLQSSQRLGLAMLSGALLAAIAQLAFAALTQWLPDAAWSFAASAVLVMLVAGFSSVFLITSMTAMQLHVPDRLRGRVMSLHGITFSLIALGALWSGGLASFIGAPLAVGCGASVIVLAVVWVAAYRPEIRTLSGAESPP